MTAKARTRPRTNYRLIRTLHIYSSMAMLLIMLFFTVTGLTLNHRDWFSGQGETHTVTLTLPATLAEDAGWQEDPLLMADAVRQWLGAAHGVHAAYVSYEWDADEQLLLVDMKRPGGRSSVEVTPSTATVLLQNRTKGTVAVLNDLHMGRYSSQWWRLFIDASAVIMLLFTVTGVWLVLPQRTRRFRLFALSGIGTAVGLAFAALAQLPF